jgi:hypothetical protein
LSVLNHWPDDPRAQAMWSFDHANEHAKLIAAMGSSASNYNLARYLLDPMPLDAMNGASNWDLVHQQAHDDAAGFFNVQPSLPLIDSSTEVHGQFQTWLFINSQEHDALNLAALRTGRV